MRAVANYNPRKNEAIVCIYRFVQGQPTGYEKNTKYFKKIHRAILIKHIIIRRDNPLNNVNFT